MTSYDIYVDGSKFPQNIRIYVICKQYFHERLYLKIEILSLRALYLDKKDLKWKLEHDISAHVKLCELF